jgi:PAS domain S-box-containing protein
MEQLDPPRAEHPSRRVIESCRWAFSIVLPAIAAALLLVVVRAKLRDEELPTVLIVAVATGFVAVTLLGTQFLIRALREHRESEARFQQMASNIQEIFWMIDAETKKALYVNDAYQTITGRSCQSLTDFSVGHADPKRYTQDHLRRAELLAIPAAAAIQNARLFARADIFASELRWRISTMQRTRWLKLKGTVCFLRTSFRRSFVPAQFPSPSQR